MKKNRKLIALLLSVLMFAGLLTACTEEQISTGLDIASQVIDSLPDSTEAPETENAAEDSDPAAAETTVDPEADETETEDTVTEEVPDETEAPIAEDGTYTTKEDVALYIHTYGHLPDNFITKSEAEAAGWSGGSVERYCPGKCIGGSTFGNREGILPSAPGRTWIECDINTLGASSRGSERIVFSNDGLIYYTNDHYETFELLYGTP